MNINTELFRKLKSIGWDNRNAWLAQNPHDKFSSTYSIYNSLCAPKDWNAIAEKCSTNPNHEMFGVPVADILYKWQNKGQVGADRGIKLDDYITARLAGIVFDESTIVDDNLLKKFRQFDIVYDSVLSKLHSYIGNNFVKAVHIKNKKAVGKDYVLQHLDGLEILTK